MSTRCRGGKHFGRKEGYGLLCGNCAAICRELGQSAKAEEYEVQRKNTAGSLTGRGNKT